MFAVRMPDGCVGVCDGLLHSKNEEDCAFLSFFDRKGIKRVVAFNPDTLEDLPFLGHINMDFNVEEMDWKIYKKVTYPFA